MKHPRGVHPAAAVFVFFVFAAFSLAAQSVVFPSLEPDSRAAVYAGAGPDYSWETLAEIALWASGAGSADSGMGQARLIERIRAAAAELTADPLLPEDLAERGEYVLSFMHKKFLKSYSLVQTRLDTLLENGRYNCVSSAALYLILAQPAGLDVQGVMTKDHAFASVNINGKLVDVETTNPYGFDPGNRKEFHDGFGRLTGFAYVPATNYRGRSAITPIELVSLIFSNRIADLEKRGRFAEAVPLAISRAALLEGRRNPAANEFFEDPRRDLMTRIFNYGASLLKAGKEEDALRWVAFAEPQYPDAERWQEFINAAVNNRLVKFIQHRRAAEARDFLAVNAPVLSGENYGRMDAMVLEAELFEKVRAARNSSEADAALAAIAAAEKRNLLPAERIEELRTFVTGNYVAGYHNRFADAYNKKNYDEALRILDEGLAKFPGNRQLLSDKRLYESSRR
jgi:hypothetical protein